MQPKNSLKPEVGVRYTTKTGLTKEQIFADGYEAKSFYIKATKDGMNPTLFNPAVSKENTMPVVEKKSESTKVTTVAAEVTKQTKVAAKKVVEAAPKTVAKATPVKKAPVKSEKVEKKVEEKVPAVAKATTPKTEKEPAKKVEKKVENKSPKKSEKVEVKAPEYGSEKSSDVRWCENKVRVLKALKNLKATSVTSARSSTELKDAAQVTAKQVRHYCYHAKASGLVDFVANEDGRGYLFYLTAEGQKCDFAKELAAQSA